MPCLACLIGHFDASTRNSCKYAVLLKEQKEKRRENVKDHLEHLIRDKDYKDFLMLFPVFTTTLHSKCDTSLSQSSKE